MAIPNFKDMLSVFAKLPTKGGFIGKTCNLLVWIGLVIAIIAWAARNPWVSSLGIVLLLLVIWDLLRRVMDFATAHPEVALLDGAEYIKHTQLTIATKNTPTIIVTAQDQRVPETAATENPQLPHEPLRALADEDVADETIDAPDQLEEHNNA